MDNSTDKMKEMFDTYMTENEKFEKGNGSAGTRARKALMEIRKLADTRRKEIQEIKNAAKA